ncbi:hypothetical protein HT585_24170 [Ensifer sp. HO-A22]|uniref:Uncharacterized protein n=1 Tax=Ensifer oleiphilus TaxID=2742698 RepID=A0A7Y6QAA7_9HYPH|nr:hypothetical protein [Ensifer oleiphilus]NVD41968.1 hypothetical protein [Ensifer oleiphilus]
MSLTDTKKNIGTVVRGWNARYDLEEFIDAYHLAPLEAREIFARIGPYKVDLDQAMKARAQTIAKK